MDVVQLRRIQLFSDADEDELDKLGASAESVEFSERAEITRWQAAAGTALFPLLRLVDLAGMLRALVTPKWRRRAAKHIDH